MLHLLRSVPDDLTTDLFEEMLDDANDTVIRLYEDDLNWDQLIETIFAHEKVICWW